MAYPLSSGAVSASTTKDGGGGGGGFSSTLETISGPKEEGAVRKALGLRPTDSVDTEDNHIHVGRDHRENDGGFSVREREGGGNGGLSPTSQAPGGAPLCLLLSNLGELFRWDAAAAADMCADAFPGVRPW